MWWACAAYGIFVFGLVGWMNWHNHKHPLTEEQKEEVREQGAIW